MQRFIDAQDPIIESVYAELAAGCKQTHWMWFVFPQYKGLGTSRKAQYYGIQSEDEARAYLHDPILGARLARCFDLLLQHDTLSAIDIFGGVDAMKLHACATLFSQVAPDWDPPKRVLDKYFGGRLHEGTVGLTHPQRWVKEPAISNASIVEARCKRAGS